MWSSSSSSSLKNHFSLSRWQCGQEQKGKRKCISTSSGPVWRRKQLYASTRQLPHGPLRRSEMFSLLTASSISASDKLSRCHWIKRQQTDRVSTKRTSRLVINRLYRTRTHLGIRRICGIRLLYHRCSSPTWVCFSVISLKADLLIVIVIVIVVVEKNKEKPRDARSLYHAQKFSDDDDDDDSDDSGDSKIGSATKTTTTTRRRTKSSAKAKSKTSSSFREEKKKRNAYHKPGFLPVVFPLFLSSACSLDTTIIIIVIITSISITITQWEPTGPSFIPSLTRFERPLLADRARCSFASSIRL